MPQMTPEDFTSITSSTASKQAAREQRVPFFKLLCLRDGTEVTFFDEGPWPKDGEGKDNPQWRSQKPSGTRQALLRKIRQVDELDFPVFAATEPGLKVWDVEATRMIPIPVVNKAWLERSVQHKAVRDALALRVKSERDKKAAEELARGEKAEQRISNALEALLKKFAIAIPTESSPTPPPSDAPPTKQRGAKENA